MTKFEGVYWFFIPLFAVYLSIPVLSLLRKNRKILLYMVSMSIMTISILPTACVLMGITYNGLFMNIISAKNCTYTNKQKILLIKSIHKEPEFSTITKQAIASIEMKRTQKLFADLFMEKKYIILLWLLKVYKIWILLKRKKNNLSISKG